MTSTRKKQGVDSRCGPYCAALVVFSSLLCGGVAAAQGTGPNQLRRLIDQQVGAQGLRDRIEMENASGTTSAGDPYLPVFLPSGVLLPGQSIVETLLFRRQSHAPPVRYTLTLLSGQGNP